MNTHAKRAFSAIITVAVVAITVFGVVGLTAIPVSAAERIVLTGPTTGYAGQLLTFTAKAEDCNAAGVCTPKTDYFLDFAYRHGDETPSHDYRTSDSNGGASGSHSYAQAGMYSVIVQHAGVYSNELLVKITDPATVHHYTIITSGPTNGRAGEPLTYSATVARDGMGRENGFDVKFTLIDMQEPEPTQQVIDTRIATTNVEGVASVPFTFPHSGNYQVWAQGDNVASQTPSNVLVTITAADGGANNGGGATDGGSGQTGGDATTAKTANASAAGLENIAAQAEAVTGLGSNALLIVLGIAGIILLALIAGVLLMRRKGDDESEYEGEEPYRRE